VDQVVHQVVGHVVHQRVRHVVHKGGAPLQPQPAQASLSLGPRGHHLAPYLAPYLAPHMAPHLAPHLLRHPAVCAHLLVPLQRRLVLELAATAAATEEVGGGEGAETGGAQGGEGGAGQEEGAVGGQGAS